MNIQNHYDFRVVTLIYSTSDGFVISIFLCCLSLISICLLKLGFAALKPLLYFYRCCIQVATKVVFFSQSIKLSVHDCLSQEEMYCWKIVLYTVPQFIRKVPSWIYIITSLSNMKFFKENQHTLIKLAAKKSAASTLYNNTNKVSKECRQSRPILMWYFSSKT